MNEKNTHQIRRDKFFIALGRAIAQWADVENNLFVLYANLIKSENWSALSASYHVVVGFRTKLNMVDYAFRASYTDKELCDKWHSLHERLRKKSIKRNHIAHFVPITDAINYNPSEMYLRPGILDVKAAMGENEHKYDTNHLEEMITTFGKLAQDVDAFIGSLPPLKQS